MVFQGIPANSGQPGFWRKAKRSLLTWVGEVAKRELVALLLKLIARGTDWIAN